MTFAYAPTAVRTWWSGSGACSTKPLFFEGDNCQRAAETFGIIGGVTFGFAPDYVRTWWSDPQNHCNAHF